MIELLRRQRKRIAEAAGKDDRQITIDFDEAERRQREADRRAWTWRLQAIEDRTGDRAGPNRRCVPGACRPRRPARPRLPLAAHRLTMADREHRNLILAHQEWLDWEDGDLVDAVRHRDELEVALPELQVGALCDLGRAG